MQISPRFGTLNLVQAAEFRTLTGRTDLRLDGLNEHRIGAEGDRQALQTQLDKLTDVRQADKLVSPEGFVAFRTQFPRLSEQEVADTLTQTLIPLVRKFAGTVASMLQAHDPRPIGAREMIDDSFRNGFGGFLSSLSQSPVIGTGVQRAPLSEAIDQVFTAWRDNQ